MLIECARHSSLDLQLWAEHEAADVVHGRSMHRHTMDQARAALRSFSRTRCYASTSWGKDSVVMLFLLSQEAPHVPVVNLRIDPTRNPYCDLVRDVFLSRFPLSYHEEIVSYRDCGEWFSEAWDARTYVRWDQAWRKVNKTFGDRHISGVRAKESGVRKIRMRTYGLSTEKTCAPLGWMSVQDVFGVLAANDLPIHPNYAMLGGGRYSRDHLRVSEIGDMGGATRGRREHEQEYYGDVLRRLCLEKE